MLYVHKALSSVLANLYVKYKTDYVRCFQVQADVLSVGEANSV